jgi:D-alanyl-D-alanine carboxypeptidase
MKLLLLTILAIQPPFAHNVTPVTRADLPHSWRPGCPVAPARLRRLRVSYWGFDGRAHMGTLIVHASVVGDLKKVFRRLYLAEFPIRRMRSVDVYGASDDRSMAADNTSAFNCRFVSGTTRWSMHAYGKAIDVNPVENPYVSGSRVQPPAGRAFLNRSNVRRGMAVRGGILVRSFSSVGWKWGGLWSGSPDYQHFSTTGS